ncbi:protein OSB1, mitochondrial-like [Wolffia australiana]
MATAVAALKPSFLLLRLARHAQIPNSSSSSSSSACSSCSSSPSRALRVGRLSISCSADSNGGTAYPKPVSIPWRKDLANVVHLIGVVGTPVQIKYVSSGKVLAWTRLAVKNSASDTTWINLTFWDDLAHVAFNHVNKGQQIYVSGRLASDAVEGDDNKRQVYYKVVAQELNFIEKNLPQVPLYEPESSSPIPVGRMGNHNPNQGSTPEELWQAFFANPTEWWDNRKNKRNPKSPDFKHKDTGEALWIEGRYSPPWVKSQLAKLDSKMRSFQSNDVNPSSFIRGGDFSHF